MVRRAAFTPLISFQTETLTTRHIEDTLQLYTQQPAIRGGYKSTIHQGLGLARGLPLQYENELRGEE
mgnify:CR=1 FL=1